MRFSSSRTFPGQSYSRSAGRAPGESPRTAANAFASSVVCTTHEGVEELFRNPFQASERPAISVGLAQKFTVKQPARVPLRPSGFVTVTGRGPEMAKRETVILTFSQVELTNVTLCTRT